MPCGAFRAKALRLDVNSPRESRHIACVERRQVLMAPTLPPPYPGPLLLNLQAWSHFVHAFIPCPDASLQPLRCGVSLQCRAPASTPEPSSEADAPVMCSQLSGCPAAAGQDMRHQDRRGRQDGRRSRCRHARCAHSCLRTCTAGHTAHIPSELTSQASGSFSLDLTALQLILQTPRLFVASADSLHACRHDYVAGL